MSILIRSLLVLAILWQTSICFSKVGNIQDKVHLSGDLEVEGQHLENYHGAISSTLYLKKVAPEIDIVMGQEFKGHLSFLYEELGDGQFELEEGYLV